MNETEELKTHLKEYAETHLEKAKAGHEYVCPFCGSGGHEGKSDSALSIKDNRFYCFANGEHGDIFDMIGQVEGLASFSEQKARAIELYGEPSDMTAPHLSGREYMNNRGFTDETLNRYNITFNGDNVIIPYGNGYNVNHNPNRKGSKYRKPQGEKARLYNERALWAGEVCFICEGELNALTLLQAGYPATATGGAGHYGLVIKALEDKPTKARLIIAFDNDEVGQNKAHEFKGALEQMGYSATLAIPFNYNDINDLLQHNILNEYIQRALDAKPTPPPINNITALARLDGFINGLNGKTATPATPTGFINLDEALEGGLYKGLYIIGAISSLGKTTYILQMADAIAHYKPVLYVSLEMDATELMSKSLSRLTYEIDPETAKTSRGITTAEWYGRYTQQEQDNIFKAIDNYSQYAGSLFIMEGVGDLGVDDIRQKAQEVQDVTGDYPVIFIDYLQILAPQDVRASDKQATDKNVIELKRLSRDLAVPVIAVSSFNRSAYSKGGCMEAFKESGAIEYGADVLMSMHPRRLEEQREGERQEFINSWKRSNEREVDLLILKSRNSRTGERVGYRYLPLYNAYYPL